MKNDSETPQVLELKTLVQKQPEEVQKLFYAMGYEFFNWNSGKNTPNILKELSGQLEAVQQQLGAFNTSVSAAIESLDNTTKAASESSTRLATALNRITIVAVIIAVLALTWEIFKSFSLGN